ncbi:hypothetical protein [Streptomyces halstedii]|uniref:hypothetical protein n=1 Tax=Streptomyces halstedii TaxID=1944 RepID=UPI00380547C6
MSRTKTRRRTTPKPTLPARPHPTPEFITDQQIHTAYAARLAGLPTTPITAWTPHPDGTHSATLPNGTHLTHQPGTAVFTAHIPCAQGAHHAVNITTAQHLNTATQAAGQCTHPHGGHRILTLHQAATTTAETQALDVTDLRADNDHQPKEHPQP